MALWHTLGMIITAKDMASQVLRRVERSMWSFHGAAGKVAAGIATVFAAQKGIQMGVGVLQGAFGLAEGAGKFQEQLGYLGATAEASGAQLETMLKKATLSGLSTRFDPTQVVEGMTALATAGLDAEQAIGAVDSALRLSSISKGKLSTDASGGFLAAVTKMFPEEQDYDRIANMAAQLARKSAATFQQLPGMFSRVERGSGFQQSLASTAASLALVKDVTQSAETASTTLGEVWRNLASGKKGMEFEKVTGVRLNDANNRFRDFLQIAAEVAKSPMFNAMEKGARSDFLSKMFGARQVKVMEAVFKRIATGHKDATDGMVYHGAQGMQKLQAMYENAQKENVIGQYEDAMMNKLPYQLDRLRSQVQTFKDILIGGGFADVFVPVLRLLVGALEMVGYVLNLIPREVKIAIAAVTLLAGALMPVFSVLGLVAVAAAGVAAFFATWGVLAMPIITMVGGALLAFLIKPLLIVAALMAAFMATVAGIALIGAGLFAAFKYNIGGWGDALGGFADKFSLVFGAMKQLFTDNGRLTDDMWKKLNKPGNEGALNWVKTLWIWFNRLKTFAVAVWDGFKAALMAWDTPLRFFKESLQVMGSLFDVTVDGAGKNEAALKSWQNAGRMLGEVFAGLVDIGLVFLSVLINTASAILWVIGGVKDLMGGIKGFGKLGIRAALVMQGGPMAGVAFDQATGSFGQPEDNRSFWDQMWSDPVPVDKDRFKGVVGSSSSSPAVAQQRASSAAARSSASASQSKVKLQSSHQTTVDLNGRRLGEELHNEERSLKFRGFVGR